MDGPAPQEEDFSTIPIADRLAHKNWKARVHAYEALIKTFQTTASDTDPAFKPYINNSDLLKKIVTDANAVAQEKGVECVVTLVKYAGSTAAKTRDTVVPALVDKCFGSARAGTKAQAIELVLQYVEVENSGSGVINDLLPGLGAKQPKAVAGTVIALREIIRVFGTHVAAPAPVLKALPKIFGHSDKTVRSEGTQLTHTLYQWLGPGIETWLGDLKPVQVKELKEAFDTMEKEGKGKGSLKAERLTRAQALEKETNAAAEDEDDATQDEDMAPPDPREFAEPVDIVRQLPASFQASLTSSKWKERKEVLDQLSTLLSSTPRIKDSPELGDLAKSLAVRIQGDANINCVITAAVCMAAFAQGMMGSFAKYREMVVGPMLERLKERKTNVTDAIGVALDAIFKTTSLSDILPDLQPALSSKNPQVKEGTLKFLSRCLATATSPILPAQIKPAAETLATLLEDGFEGARNEAAICMGTLMKMVGERPLNVVVDGLPDVRKAKVKEAYEKATVKCKSGTPTPPKPSAAPPPAKKPAAAPKAKASPHPAGDVDDAPNKPLAKPPARLTVKKPPAATAPSTTTKKPSPSATSKAGKAPAVPSAGALDAFKYKHTPEDADSLASELIPASIMTDLGDSNWKTRLAALEEMVNWLNPIIQEVDAEVVVRALGKKGFNEKNFQVSASMYGIFSNLAQNCPTFAKSCVALSVPHLVEKLGDMKLKKPAGDALLLYAEKTSLQFVLHQGYEPLSKQKAPKVLADAISWINTALTEFGIAGLSLKNLIDFLKTALQNSNATVRTSATKTLVTVKLFAGSGIKDLIEDLNSQLLNTIISEFDKVEGQAPPQPSRTSADLANLAYAGSQSGGKATTAADALDTLFPRVEVDGLLKGTTILADAKSEAWKTKKEALEAFQAILDQGMNKRLKPAMGEIGQILKARVIDTNKAVQTLALDIVGRIATGMGKPFERHCRLFVLPVATVLADQKAHIRTAALQTLTAIASACEGLEPMIHGIATALESSNPQQKGALLNWIADSLKEHEVVSLDLSSWALSIVSCLDDRSGDVRKGALAILPSLINFAGYDYVMQQANSLKPASRNTAVPLIQSARPANEHSATPLSKPTAKTKVPPKPASPSVDVPSPPPSPPPVPAPARSSKLTGVRRKLPLGSKPDPSSEVPDGTTSRTGKASGLKKPGIGAKQAADESLPLYSSNVDARKARTAKDPQKWINEGGPTRKDLAELLQTQMEGHASKELLNRLFSHDHNAVNDHIAGLTTLCDFYASVQDGGDQSMEAICLANFDFPLKYASIKAHEPQPNLISKCLDVVEAVVSFLRGLQYQLADNEAMCFIPTIIHKIGDAREQVRLRVQNIIQSMPKIYPYSRVFQLLSDHGLKSKVAKTRQGALDEMAGVLKRYGIGSCEPNKACPILAGMISDKDSQVRRAALGALSEVYSLVGDKIWGLVGTLPAKDKTQLEERLRRVAGPIDNTNQVDVVPAAPAQVSRLMGNVPRPNSPAGASRFGMPRSASPALLAKPKAPARSTSPVNSIRSASPNIRPDSPVRSPQSAGLLVPQSPGSTARPRSMLPSRLGRPRTNTASTLSPPPDTLSQEPLAPHVNDPRYTDPNEPPPHASDDITVIISSILSSDPSRSVDALKKIQKILAISPDEGPSSPPYKELADHTEGLIETITLQMTHIFDRPDELVLDENFRLAKHLIQTLNNFCDHPLLAESLTVDILTSVLEELTLRLLETDDSSVKKVKDLSRFINMIILRLFATARRMSIFRALFALLLQIVKPFPSNGTSLDSKEAKVAELVLKCIWKLARNIPQDLAEQRLDPVELFPAVEHFLQSVPPNEWRARATNKVPCGDMPLRTIKVIIQHVVAYHGDDVYDLLSSSFDDPSATIVYPYVYRILNSSAKNAPNEPVGHPIDSQHLRSQSPSSSRPLSPQETASNGSAGHRRSPSHRTSPSNSSLNGNGPYGPPSEEPDPDAQLLVIIGHISSETTGALHKEGITELHHFLKAYPHKRPRVEKMLESTGAAFRKYINRALATRAAEDQERDVAVADTLSKLESNQHAVLSSSPVQRNGSTKRSSQTEDPESQAKLTRLHDIFQYRHNGTQSRGTERTSVS